MIDTVPFMMKNMADFADNPNKCEKCSTVQYCMPEETRMLEREGKEEKEH